ncbi:hypothetical protein BKA63DRAFT_112094 [Paraphoma chrysanthemicola]|nr:hypothetical protein BKA63DRAFT_112094 [Paraphoma chrysanthemicola]
MSATKQEPPAQDQPKPAPVVGGPDLDTLQSMLNLVFLQSGRFIKEQQSGGGTGRQKLALQRAVPVATERFHDALDELEKKVKLAQIVLRRDLALRYQDRRKREVEAREKEAEKARLAAESRNAGIAESKKEEVKVEKVPTPMQPEAPIEMEAEKNDELEKPLEREEEKVPPPPPIETTVTQAEERDPLFDGTPPTENPQDNDFDFDAIFGDAMDTTGDNTNQDDMMDASGDMGFNFDEGPSLLRGLEDFAKSGDDDNAAQDASNLDIDMTMPDLPDLHTTADAPAPVEPPATTKPADPPAPQPPADTTATSNEAANNDNANQDAANDDGMGGMVTETANLDDLFDLDEYANPEDSAFDDAFFNFE